MTRRPSLVATLFAFLACAPSCALYRSNDNEPLDPAQIRQLEPGRTTAREAVELLGGPTQVVQLGARSAYRYDHTRTKGAALVMLVFNMGHADTRSDRLWLFFDEGDVLTHYGATLQAHHSQYALPWSDVHEESDARAADADRDGVPLETDTATGGGRRP